MRQLFICVLALCFCTSATASEGQCTALNGHVQKDIHDVQQLVQLITKTSPHLRDIDVRIDTNDPSFNVYVGTIQNGQKIEVVVSATLLEKLSTLQRGTYPYWAKVFWIAHEIGHIQLNHGFFWRPCAKQFTGEDLGSCPGYEHRDWNHTREIQADSFAARALVQLGALPTDVTAAFEHYINVIGEGRHGGASGSDLYPSMGRRLTMVRTAADLASEAAPKYSQEKPIRLDTPKNPFRVFNNKDIYGFELFSVHVPTIERCASACEVYSRDSIRRGCDAFSFDSWNQHCYLKHFDTVSPQERLQLIDVRPALIPSINSAVGVRKTLMAKPGTGYRLDADHDKSLCSTIARENDRRFFDSPTLGIFHLPQTESKPWEACKSKCQNKTGCVAFQVEHAAPAWQCSLFEKVRGLYCAPGQQTRIGYIDYDLKFDCGDNADNANVWTRIIVKN
jgi:PAN domain